MKVNLKKRKVKIMVVILIVLLGIVAGAAAYLRLPKFGALPQGERLERIKNSPNYKDGKFQNLHPTPMTTEGVSKKKMIWDYLSKKNKDRIPDHRISVTKTNLKTVNPDENLLVWMGHSSVYIQMDGKKFLIDPVLVKTAGPVPFLTKAFNGTDVYSAEDMPDVDYILISHDHWDHLNYETMMVMIDKVKFVICGLGVGAHLERWGYRPDQIIEVDWNETKTFGNDINIHALPARHFSGRSLKPNQSLWVSFLVEMRDYKFFFSGDTGYDTHFAEIGQKYGPIDLVILDSGQYDPNWKYLHMTPDEAAKAAEDLQAKNFLPAHFGKYCISNHTWNEPLKILSQRTESYTLLTPKIGERVMLQNGSNKFIRWWEE